MERVLIAKFIQSGDRELQPEAVTYEDFDILRGQEIVDAFTGSGGSTRGILEVLGKRDDIEIVPTYAAFAGTGGPVATADLDRLVSELLEAVQSESHIDGVCLALHGAMAGETEDDPEGLVVEGVRRHVGDVPLTAPMDLHGIITDRLLDDVTRFPSCTRIHTSMVGRPASAPHEIS